MDSKEPLREDQFIHEGYKQNPYPMWMWVLILALVSALFWGGGSWYSQRMNEQFSSEPFLQVTNRQMSLFLWQFPEFMRAKARSKSGYMPGFQMKQIAMDPQVADEYVVAPPEVLFRYHMWKRLIAHEFSPRPIPREEFQEFLEKSPEWLPKNWVEATSSYEDFITSLSTSTIKNLETLSTAQLPREVRRAFQGWKNFYKEGTAINELKPTAQQVKDFLHGHPNYARNDWRNILIGSRPDYLLNLGEGEVSNDQMAPFLKVAIYNYLMAQQGK